MIRHLYRLAWNRRRSTALIFLELVGCFVVLCAVATGVAFTLDNARRPLGFEYERVWRVGVLYGRFYGAPEAQRREAIEGAKRILAEVQALPDVEAAGLMENSPYINDTSSWTFKAHGREVDVQIASITPDLPKALGLVLLRGRWFEEADAALSWNPVVISENLARLIFGDQDPLGQRLVPRGPEEKKDENDPNFRVVGVIQNYRRSGETLTAPFSAFNRARLDPQDLARADRPPSELIVRSRPGVTPRFEESLVRIVHRVAPTWGFEADNLESARARWIRLHLVPLVAIGTVAGFLLLMVGFGLVGVLWQSVARRTSEIGLRRALGATAANVRMQITGELLTATTVAIGVGTLLFLQLPVLGTFGFLSWRIYLEGLAAAAVVLYAFVVLCAMYPGWMATRIQPARALQHE